MDALAGTVERRKKMKIKITEIEADARELRESNTLADNFAMLLSRCFQSAEPFEDEETAQDDEGGRQNDT